MTYDQLREQYRPANIKFLLIAESPPGAADSGGSRHFYRSDMLRPEDRLFINTIRALYPETMETPQQELEKDKEKWLRRFQSDGWYMIEALEESQAHEVTKPQRQAKIAAAMPRLLQKIEKLANKTTKLILIKSNVYEVAATPLREAGFTVLNHELLDYPGRFNQRAYREKLAALAATR